MACVVERWEEEQEKGDKEEKEEKKSIARSVHDGSDNYHSV